MNAVNPLSRFARPVTTTGRSPDPLFSTSYDVRVEGCLATVVLARTFRNDEDGPIEAVATFPVPTIAVVSSLEATIDGRTLKGLAQPKEEARETYETALDEGRLSVLHAEIVKGLHQVSIANLGAGAEVRVSMTFVMPLALDPTPRLHVPATVADLYGAWNGDEIDAPTTGGKVHRAKIEVVSASGSRVLIRGTETSSTEIGLDDMIVIDLPDHDATSRTGRLADGRSVDISLRPLPDLLGEGRLDASVLIDRSGSMGQSVDGVTKMARVSSAFAGLRTFRDEDRIQLHAFDDVLETIGSAKGASLPALLSRIPDHRGGTRIGRALSQVLSHGDCAGNVLLVTDGRSNDVDLDEATRGERRIHVLLVGKDAFDSKVSHLAARSGGHVMVTSGVGIDHAVQAALSACCLPSDIADTASGTTTVHRGGATISVRVSDATGAAGDRDDAGAFAASVLADRLTEKDAVAISVANGIVGAHTSLVLVDEEGPQQTRTTVTRKSELSPEAGSLSLVASGAPMRSALSARETMAFASASPSLSVGRSEGGIFRAVKGAGLSVDPSRAGPAWKRPATLGNPVVDRSAPRRGEVPIDWTSLVVDFSTFEISPLTGTQDNLIEIYAILVAKATGLDGKKARVAVIVALAERRPNDRNCIRIARRGRSILGGSAIEAAEDALSGNAKAA